MCGYNQVVMKLSQSSDEVKRCLAAHSYMPILYFEQVGTDKEVRLTDTPALQDQKIPYFSLVDSTREEIDLFFCAFHLLLCLEAQG